MHMRKPSEVQKANAIAENLIKGFAHHGYPLGRREVSKEIGLKVTDPSDTLASLLWKIWLDLEQQMNARVPFDPLGEVENNPAAAPLFAPIPQVNIPANLPPQVAQQAYQQVLGQINVQAVPPTDFQLVHAMIESRFLASWSRTRGKVFATRIPPLELKLNVVKTFSGWEKIPLPTA